MLAERQAFDQTILSVGRPAVVAVLLSCNLHADLRQPRAVSFELYCIPTVGRNPTSSLQVLSTVCLGTCEINLGSEANVVRPLSGRGVSLKPSQNNSARARRESTRISNSTHGRTPIAIHPLTTPSQNIIVLLRRSPHHTRHW